MSTTSINQLQDLGIAATASKKPKGNLGQDQFLKLMITQMQNQDPFKPVENGDFLAQLAQFGTVEGIQDLQKSFTDLSGSLLSNQALQASSLVGRNIVVQADSFNHQSGKVVNGMVDLKESVNDLTVDILDSSNQVIKTIQLGIQPSGPASFSWDGKDNSGKLLADGVYKMQAKSISGGKTVAQGTLLSEKVISVSLGNAQQGLLLNTESRQTYAFNSVKQVQ